MKMLGIMTGKQTHLSKLNEMFILSECGLLYVNCHNKREKCTSYFKIQVILQTVYNKLHDINCSPLPFTSCVTLVKSLNHYETWFS